MTDNSQLAVLYRDCFISNVTPRTYEEVSLLYEYWVTKKLGSYEFADAVTEHLKSRLQYFPNNCEVDAHGITLLYNHHDEVPKTFITISMSLDALIA